MFECFMALSSTRTYDHMPIFIFALKQGHYCLRWPLSWQFCFCFLFICFKSSHFKIKTTWQHISLHVVHLCCYGLIMCCNAICPIDGRIAFKVFSSALCNTRLESGSVLSDIASDIFYLLIYMNWQGLPDKEWHLKW